MKQIVQSLKDGSIDIVEVPIPSVSSKNILVRTSLSLVSSGTERMLLEFGKANYIEKARKQPDKVKEVLNKIKTDGIISTAESIKTKLDQPLELGYSNVGEVIAVGSDVKSFSIGDRVVSNGNHAEIISVPEFLAAKIPLNVKDEDATFTVVASIGLHAIRQANPNFGETFLVSGLGLIGLLTCEILISHGVSVLGCDFDSSKCNIAKEMGVDVLQLKDDTDLVGWCKTKTNNIGLDGSIITASTNTSSPINNAAEACRKRARIIMVGQTGMELRRDLFYKNEINFKVSCSYGPGRYDFNYENKGNDYPIGYVRWTVKRNFQCILDSISRKLINPSNLISHSFEINQASKAYELLTSKNNYLGIILKYPKDNKNKKNFIEISEGQSIKTKVYNFVSFVGSGNYASRILIPSFKKNGAKFGTIVSNSGVDPVFLGKKYKFKKASTDFEDILNDKLCNAVVIATRHDSHASYILKALKKGLNVFVEKPLCISSDDLNKIINFYKKSNLNSQPNPSVKPILMVGFNRRFSPLVIKVKNLIDNIQEPKCFIYNCNAGYIDLNHWTQDIKVGGGRLIGEACHFVDLLRFLAGSKIDGFTCNFMKDIKVTPDTFTITLHFENGSIGTINYMANGNKAFPKECLEVFSAGKVLRLENYRKLKGWGFKNFNSKNLFKQDKGQVACSAAFLKSINEGRSNPIPINEIFEVQKRLLDTFNL